MSETTDVSFVLIFELIVITSESNLVVGLNVDFRIVCPEVVDLSKS